MVIKDKRNTLEDNKCIRSDLYRVHPKFLGLRHQQEDRFIKRLQ